ncbi:MAG TPA: hypothetical protein VFG66_12515 [Gemmatimonadales bacterium]|nr:hypothetical protein [Gemmatimonadales bacterium]
MRSPGMIAIPVLLTLALACQNDLAQPDGVTEAAAAPTFAASPNGTITFEEPLTFVLSPESCSALTTTVTGTGISRGAVHLSPDGSGGVHFSFHNTVQGTASGADGSQYRFNYALNERDTKEPEPPFEVAIVDKFHLIGQGGTPDIAVKLYFDFIVNPDGSFTDLKVRVRGDAGCDPI